MSLYCHRPSGRNLGNKVVAWGLSLLQNGPRNSLIPTRGMTCQQFVDFAKKIVDFVAEYQENIRSRRVLPTVKPGYLRPLLPECAPEKPEKWEDILKDLDKLIMPGMTHWHHPRFHAYFPVGNSYPSIVADMLGSGIAAVGFSWIASPAYMELEVVMMDWLAKMLGLPPEFLNCSEGKGGGLIQGTASEATLLSILGAKAKKIAAVKAEHPECTDWDIIPKLVAYCSSEAHSSVERAGLLGGVKMRLLKADKCTGGIDGATLLEAIKEDQEQRIPFYVAATLGSTNSCTFDNLEELAPLCNEHKLWIHVDAAYAGAAFICPEFRYLMKGIECCDSFNFNPHKWMLVNFDCSAFWLKEPDWVINAYDVEPLYLQHEHGLEGLPDFRHWEIPLGRRFRALKLWFVMRSYGVEGLQAYIRKHIQLAHYFESLVCGDDRFEITQKVIFGLVCFRLKGTNELSEVLVKRLNDRGVVHLVPAMINCRFFLRLAICSRYTEEKDIDESWSEIEQVATEVLEEFSADDK